MSNNWRHVITISGSSERMKILQEKLLRKDNEVVLKPAIPFDATRFYEMSNLARLKAFGVATYSAWMKRTCGCEVIGTAYRERPFHTHEITFQVATRNGSGRELFKRISKRFSVDVEDFCSVEPGTILWDPQQRRLFRNGEMEQEALTPLQSSFRDLVMRKARQVELTKYVDDEGIQFDMHASSGDYKMTLLFAINGEEPSRIAAFYDRPFEAGGALGYSDKDNAVLNIPPGDDALPIMEEVLDLVFSCESPVDGVRKLLDEKVLQSYSAIHAALNSNEEEG